MTTTALTVELPAAVAAVRRATKLCQKVRGAMVSPETMQKKDRSPVTVADFASQAVVCAMLADALPNDPIVGEEKADELRQPEQSDIRSIVVEHVCEAMDKVVDDDTVLKWIDRGTADGSTPRYWTVDPIDGTKGFLRGDHYVVALALIEGGEVTAGLLGCPELTRGDGNGAVMVATRGGGAFQLPLDAEDERDTSGEAVRVSDITDSSQARFCESVDSGHSDQDTSRSVAASLGITQDPVRMDSQAKYAAVARGDASIYMRLPTRADYREKIWDHAAGMLIVEEAGGRVTDVHGKRLDHSHGRRYEQNAGIIATNGHLHDAVLEAVAKALGG